MEPFKIMCTFEIGLSLVPLTLIIAASPDTQVLQYLSHSIFLSIVKVVFFGIINVVLLNRSRTLE